MNQRAFSWLFLICLAGITPDLPAIAADGQTWNQWRGPQRNGQWPGELPQSLSNLELGWERPFQPSYSGPICDGELVFTSETVDDKFERIVALELDTGNVRWETQWEGAIQVPGYAAANGSWIKSTPALSEDALVILGMRDQVVCLDPETGDIRWQVDLAQRFGARRPPFGGVCSPLIHDQAVYVMGGGATLKLSLADGSTIWRTLADEGDEDDALSSPIIATIDGKLQLVVQTRTRLCGVDLADGSLLWAQRIEAYRNMNILTPLVIGDRVFTAAHSGEAHCFEINCEGNRWVAEEVWSQRAQAYMSSPISDGNTVYMHMKNERMTALDLDSGEILWTSQPLGKYQSLVYSDSKILVLNSRGELLAVEANRDRFRLIDQAKVANDSWAYLGIFDGGLLVRDLNSLKVYRF